MKNRSLKIYTAFTGFFLILQGTSTLLFRLYPSLHEAFPQLLDITQMIPPHSILHIITAVIALVILFRGKELELFWFSAGFGLFYTGLALFGYITHHPTMFGLQPFDHPFHLFLGVWGLLVTGIYFYQTRKQALT